MSTDREIARKAIELRTRGQDVAFVWIPAYRAWSDRKIDEGESPALIAHLDAMSIFLLPEEIGGVSEEVFEELLADLRDQVGE